MSTSRLNQQHGGILFAGMMGVVMSASLCFFVLAMPNRLFEALVVHSHLPALLPPAAPPLGANAHMLFAAAVGLLGGMMASTMLLAVEDRYLARVAERRMAREMEQISDAFVEDRADAWSADEAVEDVPVLELYDVSDPAFDEAPDDFRMPGFRYLATGEPIEDAAYTVPFEEAPEPSGDIPAFLRDGPLTPEDEPVRAFGFRHDAVETSEDLPETTDEAGPMFLDFDRLRARHDVEEPLDLGKWPRISPPEDLVEDGEFVDYAPQPNHGARVHAEATHDDFDEPRFPADVEGDTSLSALLRRLEVGIEQRGRRPFAAAPVSEQGAQLRSTLDELRRLANVH